MGKPAAVCEAGGGGVADERGGRDKSLPRWTLEFDTLVLARHNSTLKVLRRIENAARSNRRSTLRVQPFGQNLYEKTQTADSKDDLKHEPKMENKTAN